MKIMRTMLCSEHEVNKLHAGIVSVAAKVPSAL